MTASKVPYTSPAYNSLNWNTPIDSQFNTISSALGTLPSIGVSSGYTLSLTEATNLGFNLTGALTTNVTVTIKNGTIGSWIFANNTSTATSNTVTVAVASSAGATYTLNAGPNAATILYSDGTNVYSAISGSGATYLPTTGGTLTGSLSFNGANSILNLSTTTTSTNPNKFSGYSVVPNASTLEFQSGSTLLLNGTFSPVTLTVTGSSGTSTSTTLAVSKGQIAVATGGALTLGTTTTASNQLAIASGGSIALGVTASNSNQIAIANGGSIGVGSTATGSNLLSLGANATSGGAISIGGATAANNQIAIVSGGGIGINAAPASNQIIVASGNISVSASSSSTNALAVTSGTATFANTVTLSATPSAATDAVNKTYADTHVLGSPSSGSFASPTLVGQAIVSTTTTGSGTPTWGNVVGPTFRATNSANVTTTPISLGVDGSAIMTFNSSTFDTNSAFNTSTYKFTPGVLGYYLVNLGGYVSCSTSGSFAFFRIYKNTVGGIISPYASYASAGGTNALPYYVSDIIQVTSTSDYFIAYIVVTGGINGSTATASSNCIFSATFIHP